jgi:hypothetical protein
MADLVINPNTDDTTETVQPTEAAGSENGEYILTLTFSDAATRVFNLGPLLGDSSDDPLAIPNIAGTFKFRKNIPTLVPKEVFYALKDIEERTFRGSIERVFIVGEPPPEIVAEMPLPHQLGTIFEKQAETDAKIDRLAAVLESKATVEGPAEESDALRQLQAAHDANQRRLNELLEKVDAMADGTDKAEIKAAVPKKKRGRPRKNPVD